jgi:poly(hydroxyalkanoate) depolymerase family esterase
VFRAPDGTQEFYQVHVPPAYDGAVALPVMVALHGCGMTGFGWNSMKGTTQFDELADSEGFIVVYPSQRPFESLINCWNSDDPRNQLRNSGEPALLAGITQEVIKTYNGDPKRVHVSGASSGAGTAVILAATYPDIFATATSVAGGEFGLNQVDPSNPEATPTTTTARQAWAQMADRERQVPLLIFQGEQDNVVPPLVAQRLVEHWSAVDDFVDDGLLNGSLGVTKTTTAFPASEGRHAYERTDYTTPAGDTLIEYYLVSGMEHAWPGPDGQGIFTDPQGPDASELAWRFAQRHPMTSPAG